MDFEKDGIHSKYKIGMKIREIIKINISRHREWKILFNNETVLMAFS